SNKRMEPRCLSRSILGNTNCDRFAGYKGSMLLLGDDGWHCFQAPDEFVRIGNPTKSALDDMERGFVVASYKAASIRFGGAILQQNAGIVQEKTVSNRRLHADTCRAARDDHIFGPHPFEGCIQLGLIEAAESSFVNQRVFGLWLEFADDVRVPRIS